MTQQTDALPTGEQRLRSRRNAFLRYLSLAMALAIMAGLMTGVVAEMIEGGSIPAWSIVPIVALVFAAFVWFSIDYFRRVDELDLLDNLWCSLFGLYFFIAAVPSWQAFHDAGLVQAPDLWSVWGATVVVSLIAYGARKLGLR